MEKIAVNRSCFLYSVNMLRLLLGMELITQEEYDRINVICAEHYEVSDIYCV